ncbi:MAG TPA: hypothetical protein VFB52_11070 [Solirubrobacterales bacterium]|nr:hypothetical protein [Solirubrobacterales bacterium]
MKKPFTLLAIVAALALVMALPSAAAAEYLIPDGNSAVNQYTEGIPTGGGEKDTEGSGQDDVKPGKTLGAKNAHKLESKGEEGKAAAELAAETAPPTVVPEEESTSGDGGKQDDGKQNGKGNKGDGKDSEPDDNGSEEANTGGGVVSNDPGPGGSSGLGELVSAATGGSDGGIGLLLPLTIFAALVWGIVFAVRRRDHSPEPSARP